VFRKLGAGFCFDIKAAGKYINHRVMAGGVDTGDAGTYRDVPSSWQVLGPFVTDNNELY
jgi:hypothetical protein